MPSQSQVTWEIILKLCAKYKDKIWMKMSDSVIHITHTNFKLFFMFFQGLIVQCVIAYYVPYYSSMKIVFRAQSIPIYLFRQPRRQLIVCIAIAYDCHWTGLFLACYLYRSIRKLFRSQKMREALEAMQVVCFLFKFYTDEM